jgi:hypothetical protein
LDLNGKVFKANGLRAKYSFDLGYLGQKGGCQAILPRKPFLFSNYIVSCVSSFSPKPAPSLQVMGLESVARAVPDVNDLDSVRGMIDCIDDSVDMRFVAMEKLF